MLMNEIATISRDIDITPIRMLTTWGTEKLRKYGLEFKNKFWKKIFTTTEKLEEGFLYKHKKHLEDIKR